MSLVVIHYSARKETDGEGSSSISESLPCVAPFGYCRLASRSSELIMLGHGWQGCPGRRSPLRSHSPSACFNHVFRCGLVTHPSTQYLVSSSALAYHVARTDTDCLGTLTIGMDDDCSSCLTWVPIPNMLSSRSPRALRIISSSFYGYHKVGLHQSPAFRGYLMVASRRSLWIYKPSCVVPLAIQANRLCLDFP